MTSFHHEVERQEKRDKLGHHDGNIQVKRCGASPRKSSGIEISHISRRHRGHGPCDLDGISGDRVASRRYHNGVGQALLHKTGSVGFTV